MRICVHAMGDVAMDMTFSAFAKALERLPRSDHRHRVEHLGNWMMTPARIAMMRRLELTPVPNPAFMHYLGEEAISSLGAGRLEAAWPFRTILDSGSRLVFGSDAPAYFPVDPLRDIGTAVARTTRSGLTISPAEGISVIEGIRAATVDAAYMGMVEDNLGTLEPGMLADVVVLADDPFALTPEELKVIPVDLTIVQGRVVYRGDQPAA